MSVDPLTNLPSASSGSTFTNITVTNDAEVGGTLTVDNLHVNTGGSASFASDPRFKKHKRPIENIWYAYNRIRGQFFDYKASNKSSIGFMADEVEDIFPYLVYRDNKGYRHMEYHPLIAYNWEAVKDNRRSLLTLDRVIYKQERRIQRLEHMLLDKHRNRRKDQKPRFKYNAQKHKYPPRRRRPDVRNIRIFKRNHP